MAPSKENSQIDQNFDEFIHSLQEEIDQKDRTDFSPYALELAEDLQHMGTLDPEKDVIVHEWQGPCGDSVKWYLKIENDRIEKALFQTNGCITADIASEQTARLVESKLLKDVALITAKDILHALQKFPEESHHCATLALTSLHKTLDKWD